MGYKFLEGLAIADVAVEATGKSIDQAFAQAALAMFDVQTNVKKIPHKISKTVKIKSEDKKSLLFDWLSKLIYMRDIERMFFSKFEVKIKKIHDKTFELDATIYGDRIDVREHEMRTEVKGISYTMMEIQEAKNLCKIRFVLDV
jgi:SHS2 domain-containing protein